MESLSYFSLFQVINNFRYLPRIVPGDVYKGLYLRIWALDSALALNSSDSRVPAASFDCESCKSHNVLGIAPVTIIDCQLPFEYTITSRSTDVVVKLFVIEQPISPAPPADFEYLRSRMQFMMLIMRLLVLCLKEEGKPVGPYVIKMKNYVELKCLGYVLPHDLSVGFKKAATPQVMAIQSGRIQRANKKSLNAKRKGKGKGKGKDKSYIPKPNNKKTLNLLLKEHPAKDDTCHHCKEVGHCKRNCPAYLAELIKKKKQVGTASSSDIFIIELFSFPYKSWVYDTGCDTHISTSLPLRMNLLKHKHEVFETFMMFKNEVENQLGKTIKELRSDRGGEYISQEFKDYLKACGIVQQLTPPYTPQHNGVSERRNRTLLDMVRSMMNLITLPLSFWDYALESAACILNMVSTKKIIIACLTGFIFTHISVNVASIFLVLLWVNGLVGVGLSVELSFYTTACSDGT
ncbi:retrotransposon protein, putative, ty1-copia subclass [Tanacetum coccineum]